MTEKDIRDIRDSKVLAAMSHPLRRRLLDLLRLDGPATASMLAGKTGQAVGNISHHVKVLAAVELVEEAPELARDQRERWWRRTSDGIRWAASDFRDDPVAEAAEQLNLEHQAARYRDWLNQRDSQPEPWRSSGAFATDDWARMSVAEIRELDERILALFTEYSHREIPDDGQERRPVFLVARASVGQP
ncbi:helix-turn-helix transcriptional regulator [Amycolatopsis sp. NPDC051045]|uniref:helix-turn-helix transcriptional regulator n=1 Tax=Amycolatopsis sp. NPDC051045 TaxID=3156922 RepID=UPI0034422BCA